MNAQELLDAYAETAKTLIGHMSGDMSGDRLALQKSLDETAGQLGLVAPTVTEEWDFDE